jgi:hypothetical protein
LATVELLLSRVSDRTDTLPLTIDVFDCPMSARWLQMLKEMLALKLTLKKDFCFLGFPDAPEDLTFWCKMLNGFVEQVNAVRGPGVWKNGYEIKQRFYPEAIFHDGKYNSLPMFEIHHEFERLIGQEWSLSPYYVQASPAVRYLIGQLNDLCHQIESLGQAMEQRFASSGIVNPITLVSTLSSVKAPIHEDELKYFKLDQGGFGGVYVKYAQVGKDHWDVFHEGDTEIFDSNVNGLRHLSGQFTIEWGHGFSAEDFAEKKELFFNWLRANGRDPHDPKLALGRLKVGQLRRSDFGYESLTAIHRLLANYLNIESISVRDGDQLVTAQYPYHFTDPNFSADQAIRYARECELASAANAFRGVFLKASSERLNEPLPQEKKLLAQRRLR